MEAPMKHYFSIEKSDDISENVASAMELSTQAKHDLVHSTLPRFIPAPIKDALEEFVGVKGSRIYERLKRKEVIYFAYLLKKK